MAFLRGASLRILQLLVVLSCIFFANVDARSSGKQARLLKYGFDGFGRKNVANVASLKDESDRTLQDLPTLPPDSGCAAITCGPGTACDPLIPACVPVSCEAINACPDGFQCQPDDGLVCIRYPCPQFTCVPADDTEDSEDETESEEPNGCIRGLRCPANYQCNPSTNECVPLNCNADDPCPEDFRCIEQDNDCDFQPCPQFNCVPINEDLPDFPELPNFPVNHCVTECGREVPVGEKFRGEGSNSCNQCLCTPYGPVCTLALCNLDDEEVDCDQANKDYESYETDCIICPQVVPECDEECEDCQIHLQTCTRCAYATCMDPLKKLVTLVENYGKHYKQENSG